MKNALKAASLSVLLWIPFAVLAICAAIAFPIMYISVMWDADPDPREFR